MIQANKATVVTDFHQKSLEVRQMEIEYCLMVLDKLSTISAMLAGFASSSLMVGIPNRENPYMVTLFLLSTSSALGSHLLVVIVSTMCIMWGPGHALRGKDASFVDHAVYILDTTKSNMERFFWFGLLCYFVSSFIVVWLLFNTRGAVTVSVIFAIILTWLYCKTLRIMYSLVPSKIVSGHVRFNRVKNVGELMGDATGILSGETNLSTRFANTI